MVWKIVPYKDIILCFILLLNIKLTVLPNISFGVISLIYIGMIEVFAPTAMPVINLAEIKKYMLFPLNIVRKLPKMFTLSRIFKNYYENIFT